MTLKDSLLAVLEDLSVEGQMELLSYAKFLKYKNPAKRPRKSIEGICADLNISVTEEDIKEVRREMWGNLDEKFADL
jgi:hypothetical protein